jgi:hypothetical protein
MELISERKIIAKRFKKHGNVYENNALQRFDTRTFQIRNGLDTAQPAIKLAFSNVVEGICKHVIKVGAKMAQSI